MIAYGELGMHPWELARYYMRDFIAKLEGTRAHQWEQSKEKWEMVRALAYEHAVMQNKEIKGKPSLQTYWPFPWDAKKGVALISNAQERRDAIKKIREQYLKAARASRN